MRGVPGAYVVPNNTEEITTTEVTPLGAGQYGVREGLVNSGRGSQDSDAGRQTRYAFSINDCLLIVVTFQLCSVVVDQARREQRFNKRRFLKIVQQAAS